MKIRFALLTLGFSLACMMAWAGEDRVAQIIVKGATRDSQVAEIRRVLGFSEGDLLEEGSFELAESRIRNNPSFRAVHFSKSKIPSGIRVAVELELEPLVDGIEISAPGPLQSTFESRLSFLKGDPYNEGEIQKAIQELKEACRRMGYYQTEVEFSRIDKSPNLGLRFDVRARERTTVGKVTIKAPNARIAKEITEYTGAIQGEAFSKEKLTEGLKAWRQRKVSERYFEAMARLTGELFKTQTNSVDVVIEAFLGPRREISFDRVNYFSTRYLRGKIMILLSQNEFGSSLLQRVETLLLDEYRRHGFRDAQISVSPELSIQVDEGRQYLITQIIVTGENQETNDSIEARIKELLADNYDSESLKDPAAIYVEGLPILDERALQKTKSQIQDELQGRGYLNAKLSSPQIRLNPKNAFAVVSMTLNLGVETKISSIETDAPSYFDTEEIRKCITLNKDDTLVSDAVESPRACMEEFLWNHGYPYGVVDADVQISSDAHRAQVFFKIKPGPFARIGKIEVRGTIASRKEVLFGRIAAQIGDPFSLHTIAKTRQELLDSDIFDGIDIFTEPSPQGDENRVLVVDVHEKPRTSFELGVGASLEDGPRVSLITGRRNILGLGIGLKSRLQLNHPALFYRFPLLYSETVLASLEKRFEQSSPWLRTLLYTEARMSLSLDYPYMLNFPWGTDGLADVSFNRELKAAYTLNKFGIDFGLTMKPNSQIRLGPSVEYEYGNFFCPVGYKIGLGCGEGPTGAATRFVDRGETQQVTLRLAGTVDGRDSIFRPRKGFYFDANADFGMGRADLGGEEVSRSIRYLKLQTNIAAFTPLSPGVTGYLSTRFGQILDLSDGAYVPLFKRFYLGGTNSIRGFGEDQVLPADDENWPATSYGPKDRNVPVLSLGGNFVTVVRGEIRFHLAEDYDAAVFVDAGELLHNFRNFSVSSMAVGAGFGLRYATPIGPLMLDLGIRILDGNRSYESGFWKLFGLHFSIGSF